MPTLTEGAYIGDWLKAEQGHQLSRNAVTLKGLGAGTATWETGSVLAKETSTGKWALATATGSDGLEQARGILVETVAMTTSDKPGVAIVDMGPARVNQNALKWGATINDQTKRNAALGQLETNSRIKANRGA